MTLTAARLEFFLLLGYRSLDPETGMMVSYTGHVLPIRQFCAYAPGDMSTSWLEVTRHIRHLQLQPKEHAAMLAICLTFTGLSFMYDSVNKSCFACKHDPKINVEDIHIYQIV